ncbi:MAG: type II secretion system protein GspC [Thermodesulfobacteriota bacterium]
MNGLKDATPRRLNILNIILALALVPAALMLTKDYMVLGGSQDVAAPLSAGPAPRRTAPEITSYAPIIEASLFPSPTRTFSPVASATAPVVVPRAEAAAVLKGLRLLGTYVGPVSFAVIERTDQNLQRPFKEGETVFDAGTLDSITRNSVLIRYGTRTYPLRLPDVVIPPAPPLYPGAGVRAPADRAAVAPSGATLKYARKTGARQWELDQKAVLSSLEDMGQVLKDARLTPMLENGAVAGFQVTEIRARGVFDALGLKNGDILKRVNGYEITSPEKAVQVLSALKGQRSIDLDVVRGGASMSFHYDIR